MPRPVNFTRLERRFIGYLCGLEGYGEEGKNRPALAARLAGYSPKRSNQAAYKLMHRPRVRAVWDAYEEAEMAAWREALRQRQAQEARARTR